MRNLIPAQADGAPAKETHLKGGPPDHNKTGETQFLWLFLLIMCLSVSETVSRRLARKHHN